MCTTTIGVKGGHFTAFIYTVLIITLAVKNNHWLFYQIPWKQGNSVAVGKFHDSA